jgi:uncharacterized repeat protein (TIGR01451 family)
VGSLTYINVGATELAPTFCDIDADGDQDLFVGKANGTIDFWENTGSSTLPNFSLVANNYANVSGNTNVAPAFADIDGDLDYDLLVGNASNSKIRLFRNTGTPKIASWNLGIDYITFGEGEGHPTFADIDADGDSDLFIGANNGRIFFYENILEKTVDTGPNGTLTYYLRYGNNAGIAKNVLVMDSLPAIATYVSATPVPSTITASLLEWDIPYIGLRESGTIAVTVSIGSLPDSSTLINIGSITCSGSERYGTNNTGTWSNHVISMDLSITKSIRTHPFTSITDDYLGIDFGAYSAPYLSDLDGDNDDDLVIGAADKSIWFFKNVSGKFICQGSFTVSLGGRPHPCLIDETGYGTMSLFIGYNYAVGVGRIRIYKSSDPFTPSSWSDNGDFMFGVEMSLNPAPTAVDIDGDGDKDLIVGDSKGAVVGYKNNGGGNWEWRWSFPMPIDNSYRVPSFFDLDFDTDYDLFCGVSNGTIEFYENSGSVDSPVFASAPTIGAFADIDVGDYASPCFGDTNLDKHQDLLIGRADGRLSLLRNEGSYGSEAVTGKKIAYILDCKKLGSLPVNDVVVQDLLPVGIIYETYTVTGLSPTGFTQASQLLTWTFGNLSPSEYSWKITLIGSVTGASSNTVTNIATITPSSDLSPINNYSSATSHIIELISDAWVSKRHLEWGTNSPPSEAPPGGYINYKIEYGNIGLLTAPSVKIIDALPSGTTYISSSPSGTVETIGTITYVTWNLGSLPPDSGTYSVLLKVLVNPDLSTDTTLVNIASITTGEADHDPLNNLSTWTTIVKVSIIDLVIEKKGPATATVGGYVFYLLTFWNAGTATLNNVNVYDYFEQSNPLNALSYQGLGAGREYVVSESQNGYLLTLIIGTLTPSVPITVEVQFKLSEDAIMGQSIINIASTTYTGTAGIETQLENNYASWTTLIGTPSVHLHIYILPMEGTGTSGYERRYSLILYNRGSVESGATITVTLPPDLTYLSTDTTHVIQTMGSPTGSTYTIGPYYDAGSRTIQWAIYPHLESPDVYTGTTLIAEGEPYRYTLGHWYTKKIGTESIWGGLGAPEIWGNLSKFLSGETIALFPLYSFNTMVGSVSATTYIDIKAEIEPMPMKIFPIMETSGAVSILPDVIAPLSKSRSLRAKSQALAVRSTPREDYVAEGELIFYQINSETRPKLILDTRDIDKRHSFPLDEPLMISTNTYLFWVKVAATEKIGRASCRERV